jgi:hypothetical protein
VTKVNASRVVLGGIVAALIINLGEAAFGYLFRDEYVAAMKRLGVDFTARFAIYLPIVWSFVIGVLSIWLYAAIRPRYGPGPRTAVRAGLAVWALTTATFSIAMGSLGLFPARLMVFGAIWGLVETVVAVVAGAMLYREP